MRRFAATMTGGVLIGFVFFGLFWLSLWLPYRLGVLGIFVTGISVVLLIAAWVRVAQWRSDGLKHSGTYSRPS